MVKCNEMITQFNQRWVKSPCNNSAAISHNEVILIGILLLIVESICWTRKCKNILQKKKLRVKNICAYKYKLTS